MKTFIALRKAVKEMDPKLAEVFLPLALRHPRYMSSFLKLMKSQKDSAGLRARLKEEGVRVPPFLIVSITSQCNLSCLGCYASASGIKNKPSLGGEQWRKVIEEARELGVFGFVIAGGEPFIFPGLLKMCADFGDSLFIIVTNGTMLTEEDYGLLGKLSNVVVLVSIEGDVEDTDSRRGHGTHEKVLVTLDRLNKAGAVFGTSVTVTKGNYEYWMNERIVDGLMSRGAKISAFIEYIPTTSIDGLMLTEKERSAFRSRILEYRKNKRLYVIHSPGDEEFFGGCVSAGRGFAHVTPSGDLTPCPVSNVATHNVAKASLRAGLSSKLFTEIRDSAHALETQGLPCALFSHPKEVEEIAKRTGAYRTG